MTSPLNFGGSVCTTYAGIVSKSSLDNAFQEPFNARKALKNSTIDDNDVSICTGDGMHYAFLELESMETCDDCCPSFKEGKGSVSKSSLRSVMST